MEMMDFCALFSSSTDLIVTRESMLTKRIRRCIIVDRRCS